MTNSPSKAFLSDIKVVPGTDFTVLGGMYPPSGFEVNEFTQVQIDGICEFIRDLYINLLLQCPQSLAEQSPRTLEAYCLANTRYKSAATLLKNGETVVRNAEGEVLGFAPPDLKGIGINMMPSTALQDKESAIFHELVHVVQRNIAHGYLNSILEAFVARVEKEKYRDREADFLNFGNDVFNASTGVCAEGMQRILYSPTTCDVLYSTSYFACDALSLQHVWKICEVLSENALSSGIIANRAGVIQTMQSIAQEQAATVLRNLSFQTMKEGIQHVVFKGKFGKEPAYKIESFHVKKEQERRISDFPNTILASNDLQGTGGIRFLLEHAGVLQEISVAETLQPSTILSQKEARIVLTERYGVPKDAVITSVNIKSIGEIPLI